MAPFIQKAARPPLLIVNHEGNGINRQSGYMRVHCVDILDVRRLSWAHGVEGG